MHASLLETTRELSERALGRADLQQIGQALAAHHVTRHNAPDLIRAVTEDKSSLATLDRLKVALGPSDGLGPAALERFLLVCAVLDSLPAVPALPVSDSVKTRFYDEFRFYASDPGSGAPRFEMGSSTFVAMCKVATFRRFPAGQFDWEIAGIRRSDLLSVSLSRLPATLAFAAVRMRGLAPVFFSHLNWRRPNRSLLEEEANRSYYRMARAIELQPEVRGFAACSWFRSPATHRVSPHLAWLSRVFVENGGFVVEAGADNPDGGVLYRSQTRKQMYDSGQFRPTNGLVMWPRNAMIAWAAAHPEFDDARA